MKLSILAVCVLVTLFVTLEAKKGKEQWREKKHHSKFASKHGGEVDVTVNKLAKKGIGQKSYVPGDGYEQKWSKFTKKMKEKASVLKKKYHDKKKSKLAWLNIKPDADCDKKCKYGEVCVSGPVDKRPLCVHKKDLKKSMKLFHRYHKKDRKAWKKFQKKNYKKDIKWLVKENKLESKKEHLAGLKKHHLKKYTDEFDADKKFELTKGGKDFAFSKADDPNECTTGEFVQMRTRMMGWFHLLHSQDHLARKTHGGNIRKFYKHVSVKEEMREHKGMQCSCLKSAMWQFNQMDKNSNDHLTDDEMAMLEENTLEPCMKPYLTSCDRSGDGKLSSDEWCCCFANILAPCFQKVDEIRKSASPTNFIPRCDKEGYYMREQCKSDGNGGVYCWCVDINGNELKGTGADGRAHCTKLALYGNKKGPFN